MRKITFLLALLCVSVMGWATTYCHTEINSTNNNGSVYMTCSPTANENEYKILFEGTNSHPLKAINAVSVGINDINGVSGGSTLTFDFDAAENGSAVATFTCTSTPNAPYVAYIVFKMSDNSELVLNEFPKDMDWTISCSGGGGGGKASPNLSLNVSTLKLNASLAETFQIVATQDGDGAITYESNNTGVATISNTGEVTAVGRGSATITVRSAETDDYAAGSQTVAITITGQINWTTITAVDNSGGNFKVYTVAGQNVVNVQHPGFASEDGIYTTFPNVITECSLAEGKYAIQDAGMVLYLSAFTEKVTPVTVTAGGVNYLFYVYKDNGNPLPSSTSEYCEYENNDMKSTHEGVDAHIRMSWITDADGNVIIYMQPGSNTKSCGFRNKGFEGQIGAFVVSTDDFVTTTPASTYFKSEDVYSGQVYELQLIKNLPANAKIKHVASGHALSWTSTNRNDFYEGNAYCYPEFIFTYGGNCSGIQVSATPNNGEWGSAVVKEGDDEVTSVSDGTSVTFIATPNSGYVFVNWTENDVEVSSSASYVTTITAAKHLTANFDYVRTDYCQYTVLSNESAVQGKKLYMTVGSIGGGRYQIKYEGSAEAPLTGLSNGEYVINHVSALTDVDGQATTGSNIRFTKANGRINFNAAGNGSATIEFELEDGYTIDDIFVWANNIYFNTAAGELGYVDNNSRLGLFGNPAPLRHNIAWNSTCVDAAKPVMNSASLEGTTSNSALINVSATDDHVVDAFHVVDDTYGVDKTIPVASQILVTGLSGGVTYNFIITAIDACGKESDSGIEVEVEMGGSVTAPTTSAPTPPASDDKWVRPIYSNTYTNILEHDFVLQNWGSVTGSREVIAGNDYILYDLSESSSPATIVWGENNAGANAIVAVPGKNAGGDGINTGVDASSMEKLHLDVWSNATSSNVEVRVNDEMLGRINLSGMGWQQFELRLEDHVEAINPASVRWMKFSNISGAQQIALDNVYFWREPVAEDENAPTDVTAEVVYADLYTASIEVSATEDNNDISYTIKLGDVVKAVGVGTSGATTTIKISGLNPNTNYSFSVIATDLSDNSAAPVNVVTRTKAIPSPAPIPSLVSAAVKSLYSETYTAVTNVWEFNANWWQAPSIHTIDLSATDEAKYYDNIPASSTFGWHFASDAARLDLAGYQKLHVSIYPMKSGTIDFYPVIAPEGEFHRTSQTLVAGQWNEVVIDYTDKTFAPLYQLGFTAYSSLGAFFIDNVYFYKDPELVRDDDWMAPGELGTICIPNGAVATGGDLYELVGMNDIGKIIFATVPDNEMEPGKPYLFEAKSNAMKFYYTAETPAVEPDNSGAMKGSFTSYTLYDLDNVYYFAGHALWSCDDLTELNVIANRAYVKLDEVVEISPSPVPGRRFVYMDVHGPNTTTGVDELNASETPVKVIIDGKLFILRGEKMYDVTGSLVK